MDYYLFKLLQARRQALTLSLDGGRDRCREQCSDLPNVVMPGLEPASLRFPSVLTAQGQARAAWVVGVKHIHALLVPSESQPLVSLAL